MQFQAAEGDVGFRFSLDFDNERLQFDLFNDLAVSDTGTAESAERVHEVSRFWQDYFANGQLQIFNSDTGELISRKDAYLPLNMWLDDRRAAADLACWKAVAEQRRERGRKFSEEMQRNARGYNVQMVLASYRSAPRGE